MTEVLHTADTHIGYRQYNSPARRADFLDAFERVLRDAVERDVDAVVHAGDVFHDRRPGLQDLLGTVDALRILDEAGIPFLAIVGNHEGKRDAQWLDLFERLGLATRLDAAGTEVGDVTLYGLDYVPRSRRDDLSYDFDVPETDAAALVAHGQFAPLAPAVHGDAWDVAEVIEGANVDFDAVLLGDEHEADQDVVAETRVTYSGSTERTSASERDDRGYNLVTFDPDADATVDVRRKGLATRDFCFVDVDLQPGEGSDRVRERVREYDVEDAVVVVTVEGEGDPVTPASVEELARERGALVARVNDRRDIEAEEEETLDVTFADPDDAVHERVREMGLSGAARDVDETVRSSDLADSNVREAVRGRIEDLLDDDPDAFDRVPGESDEPDRVTEDDPGDLVSEEDSGEQLAADDPDEQGAEEDPEEQATVDDPDEQVAAGQSGEGDADRQTGGPDSDESTTDGAGENQASMEEYL